MVPTRHPHVSPDVIADNANWITPEKFHAEFPQLGTLAAIHRDIRNRKQLGLEKINAVRRFGRAFSVHRERYAAWRMGELNGHGNGHGNGNGNGHAPDT